MFTDKEERYERQRLRMFWTHHWIFKDINDWTNILSVNNVDATETLYFKVLTNLFKDALIKMIFEKRLTRDEASSLFDMISGDDKESLFLALTIMQQKKHTIFLKK